MHNTEHKSHHIVKNDHKYMPPDLQQHIWIPVFGIASNEMGRNDSKDINNKPSRMKFALLVVALVLCVACAIWLGNTASGLFDNDFISSIVSTVVTFFTGGVMVILVLSLGPWDEWQ